MAKWKLCRQTYSDDTYEFTEGDEVTIGRGTQNTIILPSLNISRKHCAITVKKNEVIIEDLKSANGVYVGLKKITPNEPVSLSNNDRIGLGWTDGAPLAKVNDAEQFVFKLLKITNDSSIINRIQFQNEPSVMPVEIGNHSIDLSLSKIFETNSKLTLKRKSNTGTGSEEETCTTNDTNKQSKPHSFVNNSNNLIGKKIKYCFNYEDNKDKPIIKIENDDEQYEAFAVKQECIDDDEVQIIDSDSDSEQWYIRLSQNSPRKSFTSFNENRKSEDCQQDSSYSQLDDDLVYVNTEFKIKDEFDEEYKDDFITILPPSVDKLDGTYSNKFIEKTEAINKTNENSVTPKFISTCNDSTGNNKEINPLIPILSQHINIVNGTFENEAKKTGFESNKNNTLEIGNDLSKKEKELKNIIETTAKDISRKIQLTDHIILPPRKSSHNAKGKIKNKRHSKSKSSSSKIQITNSQKEERKKKLRAIATKDKGESDQACSSNILRNEECSTTTSKVIAKVTTSNRGAFLIDSNPHMPNHKSKRKSTLVNKATSKKNDVNKCSKEQNKISTTKFLLNSEMKKQTAVLNDGDEDLKNRKKKNSKFKSVHNKHRTLSTDSTLSPPVAVADTVLTRRYSDNMTEDINKKKDSSLVNGEDSENLTSNNKIENEIERMKQKEESSLEKSTVRVAESAIGHKALKQQLKTSVDIKLQYKIEIPIQKVKPVLKSSTKTILKPMKENKEPNKKSNKRVSFSDAQPEIREFEIEQGNQMKKTSSAKSRLPATWNDMPMLSLQKSALVKILRWSPRWLEEQNTVSELPPILGHTTPTPILHSFQNHRHYVKLMGELLMIEIWECLTQGYMKTRFKNKYLQMRIESIPLVPPEGYGVELINLNVNVSVPTVEVPHSIPREGVIMMVYLGDDIQICRFFLVNYVRCLPSPPNNVNSFYSISLQTLFTEKIKMLQQGAVMYGRNLAYINKDLRLFNVMESVARSPLMEVILKPQPQHFALDEADQTCTMESQWTAPLNDSQRKAVMCVVSAAKGERPRIHMIQGPPGTGKSRVICAIVMEYFYDAAGKKQKNRGKILLCATSNAAVDELVIRLLDIRQSLPQPERLRVVRVGCLDAMHPRARDISLSNLSQRDAARLQLDPTQLPPGLSAEISLLEAKKNMWQTKAMSAGDDARVAYCQNRMAEIANKIALFRSSCTAGGGTACDPQQLALAERRVLEGADVVLTTLSSASTYKMHGLARRIALCVVDEAGQTIEPETLAPLTLGVTHLALVGDPQQLPGYICSKRAKELGLADSLFSRLASCAEAWPGVGPVLLDRQYRMHPQIVDYPNRAFYDGRVRSEPTHAPKLDVPPYFVLGIISGDNGQDASRANEAEAWGAARVALALRSRMRTAAPSDAHSLAVITPYAAQRDLLRRHLRMLIQAEGGEEREAEVEVNTVDSFQGQERSVVVASLARSKGVGFLTSAGRMNVMLTRAKHVLVLCINPRAVENNHQWRSLVEDAQRRNLYGTLPIQMCRHPSSQQVSHQEILQYLSSNPPVNNTRNPPFHSFKHGPHRNKYRRRHNYVRHNNYS